MIIALLILFGAFVVEVGAIICDKMGEHIGGLFLAFATVLLVISAIRHHVITEFSSQRSD